MLILWKTMLLLFLLGSSTASVGETLAQHQRDGETHADSTEGIARLAGRWKGRIHVHGKSMHYLLTLKADPQKSDFRLTYVREERRQDTCRSRLSRKHDFEFTQEVVSRSCDREDFFGIVWILPGWQIPGDSTATFNMFTKTRGEDIASGLLRRVDTIDEAEPSH